MVKILWAVFTGYWKNGATARHKTTISVEAREMAIVVWSAAFSG
jgi:hypothetical protein